MFRQHQQVPCLQQYTCERWDFFQSEQKWKQLADLATSKCEFGLAQECLHAARDFGGLLLLASSAGNANMVGRLGSAAEAAGQNNVAFLSYFSLGK